jgi:hypothetical protein
MVITDHVKNEQFLQVPKNLIITEIFLDLVSTNLCECKIM